KSLQRQRFLPAVGYIQSHSIVLDLQSNIDYRQQHAFHRYNYYTPIDDTTLQQLNTRFNDLAGDSAVSHDAITIHQRPINVVKRTENIIWFDFKTICGVPRSQRDFLTIAEQFDAIIVSNLTTINAEDNNLIRSLINFIDVMYDQKTLLIISAEKPIQDIYKTGRFLFSFARTQSRITEMQAENWSF
ncbi:MAG: cell division protein ZapE, partial [Coxiellaceae bacterium]|nr:cell division protein ZapE [Coxiellaceae bacterium]